MFVYLALLIQAVQSLKNIVNITLLRAKGEKVMVVANFHASCH